jgi:hypothetical protein
MSTDEGEDEALLERINPRDFALELRMKLYCAHWKSCVLTRANSCSFYFGSSVRCFCLSTRRFPIGPI